jgi:hypothetical protein
MKVLLEEYNSHLEGLQVKVVEPEIINILPADMLRDVIEERRFTGVLFSCENLCEVKPHFKA